MDLTHLFLSQITDLFRIGLTVALMLTAARTGAVTGWLVPLAAGVVFIAVLIPTTLTAGQGPVMPAILMGLVSTSVILAVALAARELVLRGLRR